MWKELSILFAILAITFGASLVHCPEGTTCQLSKGYVEAASFDFLNKFTTKQYRSVLKLTMSNASIDKIDPKLKYLKNLEYLDLSYNNIQVPTIPSLPSLRTLKLNGNNLKYIELSTLPPNIEELDLSNNLLAHIPKDWKSLKSLRTLHLYKNPVDCDCYNYNVLNYERLLKDSVSVPETVTCHLPKKFAGKNMSAVNCTIEDIMLYDEPYVEGSGASDIFEDRVNLSNVNQLNEVDDTDGNTIVEDDYLPAVASETTVPPDTLVLEEGSGDEEGSGYMIPTCLINCSTPEPVGKDDEKDASPLPNLKDQLDIIGSDIFNGIRGETESTVAPTTKLTPVVEEEIKKEVEPELHRHSDKDDVELISNNTRTGELERATAPTKSSSSGVYIIIGIGLFIAFVFIVCFVKKRKKKLMNNRREFGEEMKPIGKNSNPPVTAKPGSNIPEHIPLINGQNGKSKDDTPVLKTFTPLAHPETVHDERDFEEEDIEIRDKPVQELLTPQRERVTIRASELPDSIPKTPILVQRHKNSEGDIVTTVMPP